ncbi:MAG: hypothetical protein KKA07_15235 [Bacteroidetes bacterium]|nr:hypothetical protein [Bacteroidota bacterium]MBU1720415.1 hypothetical protein [Bacteroidota bacterium]
MVNQKKIIQEIEKSSRLFLHEPSFCMKLLPNNKYRSVGGNTSKAINNNKNAREEIKVIRFFKEYWLFIEVTFNAHGKNICTSFSLSMFHGDSEDNVKSQLFRAEWDSYADNLLHPQPHWHFYSDELAETVVTSFCDLIDEDRSDFLDLLKDEQLRKPKISKIHFAMSAFWKNDLNGHIHFIEDDCELISWYNGLLNHLSTQLQYFNNK